MNAGRDGLRRDGQQALIGGDLSRWERLDLQASGSQAAG
jgi:hypothetical protein